MDGIQPRRVRVKICGITSQRDAEDAIALGADALGFNTWPGTKRCVDLLAEGDWLRRLPPFVTKVALVVNAPLEEAKRTSLLPFIDAVQFHGDEDPEYCAAFAEIGRPFVKALRIRQSADIASAEQFSTPHVLVDAHVPGLFGGTGVKVNLELAGELRARFPHLALILAGGLRPDNVAEAVRAVRPYAVDVSSGVEESARKKDPGLMRAFIEAAHEA